jgi:hypothetical protein
MRLALVGLALLALSDSCPSSPGVAPMPERGNTADFAIVNRTAISNFAEIYVLVHVPTGKCFVSIDPPGEGGGAITSTEQVVCMTYMQTEKK